MRTLSVSRQWASTKRQELSLPLASLVTTAVLGFFLLVNEHMWHWFVVPTYLCGLLITPDAARWISGQYDKFDIKGIIGVYGWYFFFLSPLIFIHFAIGMPLVDPPPDWRPWVGYLSLLNIIALKLYLEGERIGYSSSTNNTYWKISRERITPLFLLFGGVSLLAQAYFLIISGGIAGIIGRLNDFRDTGNYAYSGLGVFSILSGVIPSLLVIYLTLKWRKNPTRPVSILIAVAVLAGISMVRLFTSGLEGSRSSLVFMLMCYAGIIHHYWSPFKMRHIVLGVLIISMFMYLYGFYKDGGLDSLERVWQGEAFAAVEEESGRDLSTLLIGDFSRVYVQSYQIYRLATVDHYDLRWGNTYLWAIIMRTPSWIWPGRPYDDEKVIAATELLLGPDVYRSGDRWRNSPWVHGLLGEAMLNVGVLASPLVFLLWGYIIGWFRRATFAWRHDDSRHLLAPFIIILLWISLFSDMDNIFSWAISNFFIVFLLVTLISQRVRERVGA